MRFVDPRPTVRFCPQCGHGPLAPGLWTCCNSFCQQAEFEDNGVRNRRKSRLSPEQRAALDDGVRGVRIRRQADRDRAGA